ncbi:capsule biosynthesis GfcC family protein [Escherichia coli]
MRLSSPLLPCGIKRHVEPPPGSQLLVGLFCACTARKKYADLNDQIVSVLTQRVPD